MAKITVFDGPHRAKQGHAWEVVMYQQIHHHACFSFQLNTRSEAEQAAMIMAANPNLGEVVVHYVTVGDFV